MSTLLYPWRLYPWTLPFTPEDKRFLRHNPLSAKYGNLLIYIYLYYILPYLPLLRQIRIRSNDAWASGITFFYGCAILALDYKNWRQVLPAIADYNLLYLLVDHYIDDISLSGKTKKTIIAQMTEILHSCPLDNTDHIDDVTLKAIADIYSRLVQKYPAIHPEIVKLFEIEVKSVEIQKDGTNAREVYYQLACAKGGYTLRVLQAVLDSEDRDKFESMYQLGIIMQLLDDCLDMSTDIEMGIHTIATYEYNNCGTLDNLLIHIMELVNNLPKEYNIFKIIYSTFIVYIPDRWPQYFTEKLRSITTTRNMFEELDGAEILSGAIGRFIPE